MKASSLGFLLFTALLAALPARAAFQAYSDQSAWESAAGSFASENFDSFAPNTPISALPALHLSFAPLIASGFPGVYEHAVDNTPSGPRQIANFPGNSSILPQYQNGDVIAYVDDGVDLYGFAFWNGDPQGDALLRVYDRSNNLLGSVTAAVNTGGPSGLSNSFAGFITDSPAGRLEWEGATGDGWNHYDDFEATFAPVPEPASLGLLLASLTTLAAVCGRRRRS
jgi:hypothetical protein